VKADRAAVPDAGPTAARPTSAVHKGAVEAVTLRDLVARNLGRLRTDAAVSHDDIAEAARLLGLDWTASWLTAVERGTKPLTAEQFVALPVVLTRALGHKTALADLLLGDDVVRLGKAPGLASTELPASYLRDIVTGVPFQHPFGPTGRRRPARAEPTAAERAAEKLRTIRRLGLGHVDVRALARAEAGAGDAEDKIARRLGVPVIAVVAAAAGLWGRSLTDERDARLGSTGDPDRTTPSAATRRPSTATREPSAIRHPSAVAPKPSAVVRQLTAELTARVREASARVAEEHERLITPDEIRRTAKPTRGRTA
jgi:hypothetical protein